MDEPLGYLLTWTCHGAWLHGDARVSVARGYNVPGTEFLPPNPTTVQAESARAGGPAITLTPEMRVIAQRALQEHAEFRGWELHAVAVRSNHVHVVIANPGLSPEKLMTSLKAWATRRLREARAIGADDRVWTRHGSTRYLWDDASVSAAVAYVQEGQDAPR